MDMSRWIEFVAHALFMQFSAANQHGGYATRLDVCVRGTLLQVLRVLVEKSAQRRR